MCIGESIFILMDKKEYEKIKISDIVKTAGVSRMTFTIITKQKKMHCQIIFMRLLLGIFGSAVQKKLVVSMIAAALYMR